MFGGVAAVVLAAILPNITSLHGGPWGYPINWEILATLLFAISYGAVVIAIIRPVRTRPARLPEFAQQAATLLSSANEQDHIDFSSDLERSLPILIREASFLEQIPRETSAFFDFIHRNRLERASYAFSFLRIVADPTFCETLVKRLPWQVVYMLRKISEERLYSDVAAQLVRELAHEIGYHGFGTAPLLSDALFSNEFILERYNPFNSFFAAGGDTFTPRLLQRFNSAAERCYSTLIEAGIIHRCQATFSIQSLYRTVFMTKAPELQQADRRDFKLPLEIHNSVVLLRWQTNCSRRSMLISIKPYLSVIRRCIVPTCSKRLSKLYMKRSRPSPTVSRV